jgi:hypothetical protein
MAVPLVWRQAVSGRIGPNATGRASAGEVEEVKAAPAEAHAELWGVEEVRGVPAGPVADCDCPAGEPALPACAECHREV